MGKYLIVNHYNLVILAFWQSFSCNDFDHFVYHLVKVARVAEPLLAHRAGERQLPGVDESVLGQVLRVPNEFGILNIEYARIKPH